MKETLKPIKQEIDIPEGTEVELEGNEVRFKRQGKETKRKILGVLIEKKDNKLVIKTLRSTKREKKQINTSIAHINNLIAGLEEDFVYKLQVCSVHFPMNISVKDNFIIIKNFFGETKERKARILDGAEVKLEKELITVTSPNKEIAGQTAANIEKAAKIKSKDRRIFQDGIFIIEKSGKKI
jgi:large subunit ribosomal protein L6